MPLLPTLALATALMASALPAAQTIPPKDWLKAWRRGNPVWKGVHLGAGNDANLAELEAQVPALRLAGVNVLIVEVNYSYQFASRPELRDPNGISRSGAEQFAKLCRANGIRPIPMINCMGHQSWAEGTFSLLNKHPELDETPGQFPANKGIYCRSWCPQHPELEKIVLPLIDELIEAFQADAFHVGLDEVFLIASEFCPRCKGEDPAKLFAKQVNDLHRHLVKKRKLEMLMWADRLLDGKATGYGEWEAATNGTAPSIDRIPRDIIQCDWHYEQRPDYPSLKILTDKGFRVWPSAWRDPVAAKAFAGQAAAMKHKRILGHLATTWGEVKTPDLPTWRPLLEAFGAWPARR